MSKTNENVEVNRINLFLHAENVRIFDAPRVKNLPVTVVTGFLGSGKTTLLNHILSNKSNLRIAAAINDFAALNIDEKLVASKHQQTATSIVELSNGCICCHLLDDLKEAVWKLVGSDQDFSYLVVETSGVSDPLQIIRTLDQKFGKCFRARLDSVVTVVDADAMMHVTEMSASAIAQLQHADVILLNKMDLLENNEESCRVLEEQVRAFNETAVMHRTKHCNIPLSAIMDVTIPSNKNENAITHEKSAVPIYVSATGGALRLSSTGATVSNGDDCATHLNKDDFISVSETISEGPLSLYKLQQFICSNTVRSLTRIKGVLWIQGLEEFRCVLHMSGRGRLGFELDGKWTGPPLSEIAFIGSTSVLNEEQLKCEFQKCCLSDSESVLNGNSDSNGLNTLRESKEFVMMESKSPESMIPYFRLTGSAIYGYSEHEIERDLRIDTNAMNKDLADTVNASIDEPKAFLTYTEDDDGKTVLSYSGIGEPANNAAVLFREARKVLADHFRNVQVCKCGA